jgi:protein-S-isoprenylcysteine O-methyltransferase Ste14
MDEVKTGQVEGRLNRAGVRYVIREEIRPGLYLVLMSVFSGTWQWWNAWTLALVLQATTVVYHCILIVVNSEILNARGTRQKGTKSFDRWLLGTMALFGLAIPVIAALDVGAPGWTAPAWLLTMGILLMVFGTFGITWAVAVNRHFEVTVRIQKDRQHSVITCGPYAYIRHPGYAFGWLALLGFPLILGSGWALAVTACLLVVLAVRTALEDQTLQNELEGYRDYAASVRWKLIPGVW